VMRDLIHALKFGDRHESVCLFGRLLRSAGAELLSGADVLIPVPLHRSRLWKRRFNQSAILARWLSAATAVPLELYALRRVSAMVSQVGLSRAERHRNVAVAFGIAPGAAARIKGKRVVLIDDVITTGATLDACARVLKDAGAAEVDCLALALVVDEEQSFALA
jgi:ComF family protein